jgi:hypothetical protein
MPTEEATETPTLLTTPIEDTHVTTAPIEDTHVTTDAV